MSYKISKIELPASPSDWGIVQINGLSDTYFRFDLQDGKPVLDDSFFANRMKDENEKHRTLDRESELYKGIQKLLNEYFEKNQMG
jgi:hypothetical protein